MKVGGVSWNGSSQHKSGVLDQFACVICNRKYKMLHHKNVHERLCRQREASG